ncbi:MAG: nuclear transport factor 2 family protein [Thermomicrobiales bacterium]
MSVSSVNERSSRRVLMVTLATTGAGLALTTPARASWQSGSPTSSPTSAIADDLRSLEAQRLHSLATRDLDAARSLMPEDFQLVNPGGVSWTRDEYLGFLESGDLTYNQFAINSDVTVFDLGEGAVLRYRGLADVVDHGMHFTDSHIWVITVYQKREGGWACVGEQATVIQSESPPPTPPA